MLMLTQESPQSRISCPHARPPVPRSWRVHVCTHTVRGAIYAKKVRRGEGKESVEWEAFRITCLMTSPAHSLRLQVSACTGTQVPAASEHISPATAPAAAAKAQLSRTTEAAV